MSDFKVGDTVSYHEDGGVCLCELVAYEKTDTQESATLKIVHVDRQPSFGEYIVGEEFSVMHRTAIGGWGGDWHIRPDFPVEHA